jgi:hypothetical protein
VLHISWNIIRSDHMTDDITTPMTNVPAARIDLSGSDITITAGKVHGRPLGDLIRHGSELHAAGEAASVCVICGAERAQLRPGRFGLEAVCRQHAYEEPWITQAEMTARLAQMRGDGVAPSVAAAYFTCAIKRLRD